MTKHLKSLCLTALAIGSLMGCSTTQAPTQPVKTATTSESATPRSESTPRKQEFTEPEGGGTGGGAGSSTGGSTTESKAPDGARVTQNTVEPDSESPAEWRKKNFKPRPFNQFKELTGYQTVRGLNIQPTSPTNREEGKRLYQQACVYCHALDGKPLRTDPSLTRYNMADLSDPRQYKYGSTAQGLYRSIAFGVPAPPMGNFKDVYKEQQIWDIVNYVQSIQSLR